MHLCFINFLSNVIRVDRLHNRKVKLAHASLDIKIYHINDKTRKIVETFDVFDWNEINKKYLLWLLCDTIFPVHTVRLMTCSCQWSIYYFLEDYFYAYGKSAKYLNCKLLYINWVNELGYFTDWLMVCSLHHCQSVSGSVLVSCWSLAVCHGSHREEVFTGSSSMLCYPPCTSLNVTMKNKPGQNSSLLGSPSKEAITVKFNWTQMTVE